MEPYGGLTFFLICSIESESLREPIHLFCLHSESESSVVGRCSMIFPWFYSQKVAAMELEPKWPHFCHCTLFTRHGFIGDKPFHHFHLDSFHKAVPSTRGLAAYILYGHTRVISKSAVACPSLVISILQKRREEKINLGKEKPKVTF